MPEAKKNPFSKPYKERAPGTRHRGPGKNNKVRMTKTQKAIENGTIEQSTIATAMATFVKVRFVGTLATLRSGGSSKKRKDAIEAMRKQGMAIRTEAMGPVRKRGRPEKVMPTMPLLAEGHNGYSQSEDRWSEAV